MYYIIKCIVQGKQALVKNTNLRHPSSCVKNESIYLFRKFKEKLLIFMKLR